jgi:endoglucanase
MNELLQQLSEAVGVSGEEKEVRLLIRDLIVDHVDSWHVDAMGNLLAVKQGTGNAAKNVLVDAHMDEVGLMIIGIESDGTLRFEAVGGISDRTLLGKVVQVGPKKLTGVIGARPTHLLSGSQHNSIVKRESMRIDIGATKNSNAKSKVDIGDRAAFVTAYEEQGPIAIGKAFDDRVGCAVLVELLRRDPYPFTLHASFSVQEEVGLRGAPAAAYGVRPDLALVLECTPAYDQPHDRDVGTNVRLGAGPAIYVMDAGTIQHPRLVSHIMRTADRQQIPFQVRQPGGGGTNTAAIQRLHGGIPAATIAAPARYIHAPASMIHREDFQHVIELADATLRTLSNDLLSATEQKA